MLHGTIARAITTRARSSTRGGLARAIRRHYRTQAPTVSGCDDVADGNVLILPAFEKDADTGKPRVPPSSLANLDRRLRALLRDALAATPTPAAASDPAMSITP